MVWTIQRPPCTHTAFFVEMCATKDTAVVHYAIPQATMCKVQVISLRLNGTRDHEASSEHRTGSKPARERDRSKTIVGHAVTLS